MTTELEHDTGVRGSPAAIAGLVFAGLFVLGWALVQQRPALSASDQEVIDYFSDPASRRASLIAGLYVIPFTAIAFVWFMAALRARFVGTAGRENTLLSTVHLVAGSLFVAALFLIAAVELAMVWMVDSADGETVYIASARAMLALGTALAQMVGLRSAAVFIAVTTTRAKRSGLFPSWFVAGSFTIALVLLLAATRIGGIALLMPIWVGGSSILVLLRRRLRPEGPDH